MRPIRLLAALALALVLLLACGRGAFATSFMVWSSDMSRGEDSLPPSRPSVKLVAIHRAPGTRLFYSNVPQERGRDTLMLLESRSSSAAYGYVELMVRAHDDRSTPDRLGWRPRLVAGGPAGRFGSGPVPVAEYGQQMAVPDTGWCTLYLHWNDWRWEMGDHREALHAGIVLTCLDRARNESEPSDTVWLDAPACIAVGAVPGTRDNAFVSRQPTLAWSRDSTRRRIDRTPPDRPLARVVTIERGVNLEGARPDSMAARRVGTIRFALQSHDDQTAESKLGYRLRLAAGDLLDGLRLFGEEPVLSQEDDSSTFKNGRRLDLDWADWIEGEPSPCCPVHFGLLITSIDRAGNESAPSDTVWVDAPPKW